ncbi:MAG: hypothetical protein ABL982_25210, partial [Vicinamibacterales bacterium]
CGTAAPAAIAADGSIVAEHDVMRVLRAIPDERRGWAAALTAVRCQDCGAISLFEGARVAQRCDFCGAAAIVPGEAAARPIRPDAVLPFAVADADARDAARRWLGRGSSITTVAGVYVPYWRLTCDLYVHWHASADFGTKNSPQYEPVDGGFSEIDTGQLVPATRGVSEVALAAIAPFPLEQLRPYDPGFVSGWIVEQYQVDLVAAGDRVCAALAAAAPFAYRKRCGHEVPQRRYSGLAVTATAAVTAFHHLLLPVWVVQAVKSGRPVQVVVNGATGTIAGDGHDTWTAAIVLAAMALVAAAAVHWAFR